MTAFDETFTALGVKNAVKGPKRRSGPSQRVDDYRHRVSELEGLLDPKSLESFRELAPGYQVGWARFVFSARTHATENKRLAQMKECLEAGFKSMEAWRKAGRE